MWVQQALEPIRALYKAVGPARLHEGVVRRKHVLARRADIYLDTIGGGRAGVRVARELLRPLAAVQAGRKLVRPGVAGAARARKLLGPRATGRKVLQRAAPPRTAHAWPPGARRSDMAQLRQLTVGVLQIPPACVPGGALPEH